MNDLRRLQLISRQQLLELLTISESTLWRWQQTKSFPRQICLGPKRVAWRLVEVERWIESKSIDTKTI